MLSICGDETLREVSSPGKIGSVVFLSNDDRFVIKTLRKSEVKVMISSSGLLIILVPNYFGCESLSWLYLKMSVCFTD